MDNQEQVELGAITALDELDLTNVDTNRPLIKKDSLVKVKLTKVETKDNTAKTGKVATFTVALVEPAQTVDGKTVQPGFILSDTCSLVATEKYKPTERLARIQECLIGQKGKWNTPEMIGLEGVIRLGIEDDDPAFGARNRITSWVKKKAPTAAPTLA